jgi:GH15 family glucan-1,4-alpha-glucosidase
VGALEWVAALDPGEVAWFGTVQAFFSGWDAGDVRASVEAWRGGRGAEGLLADERAAWAGWLARGTPPADMSADEQAVYAQQLVFLKMGQVVEEGDAFGQIPASLPLSAGQGGFAHTWNITWVRDASYAIQALTEAGYLEEAGAALAFLLQDKAGGYSHYLGGLDYAVSVCRCYGDGSEWSDENEDGPNVEFDNFGLTLAALGAWTAAGGELAALGVDVDAVVFLGLAEVLMGLREQDSHGQCLIEADSSIWERHWNGQQKHFTYTSAWAVAGLVAAQDLWTPWAGDELPHHDFYRMRATEIRYAVCTWLRDGDGALAGNLEELDEGKGYDDLAAVDAFNNGTLDAAGTVAAASFARWEARLAVPSGHGFRRNDDGDAYDEQEWVFVDLRLAEAYRRACREQDAQALEDWITGQALQNHWTIPELMDPETGDYNGPAPMLGFGAGAYVLAMHHRAEAASDCADGAGYDCGDEPDDTETPADSPPPGDSAPRDSAPANRGDGDGDGGCGCGAGRAAPTTIFVFLLALVKSARTALTGRSGPRRGRTSPPVGR